MGGGRRPGPMCQEAYPVEIDDGTMCLMPSPTPGPLCSVSDLSDWDALEASIDSLQATAVNFGRAFINDARVRENYVRKIAQTSQEILDDVRLGRATAGEGARFSQELRNQIMEEARRQTSALGRPRAERMKATGKALGELVDEKAAKLFQGRTFGQLSRAERRAVFIEIIESSGRSRPSVSASIPRWRLLGRGCLAFTGAIAVYNVWTADNKVHAGLTEVVVFGGGAAGGALAGAATGLVCGPGAVFCSTALFVVGGIMGALAGSYASNVYDEELREFADWLGEGF
jgi:hypothetical protein